MGRLASRWPRRLVRLAPHLIAGGLALTLYVGTAAPGLTWANDGADGGDLISASMTFGVPHPSGYPTYCLLARLFAVLPLGSVARRYNLFSATMMAASTLVLGLCVESALDASHESRRWVRSVIAASVALIWATGHTVWSQATIAEVYSLSAFFGVCWLLVALRADRMTTLRRWGLLGILIGLGLGTHMTLLLMLPILPILLLPNLRCQKRRSHRLVALGLGTCLGLGAYGYLPLAAGSGSPINWGDPRSLSGFWWTVSAKIYRPYVFSVPLSHLPSRVLALIGLWREQFTSLGVMLAAIGLWSWGERGQRRWVWATGVGFVAYTLYALTYDTSDSYVYLIPSYLFAALWIAEGALICATSSRWLATKLLGIDSASLSTTLVLIVLGAIPVWSLGSHYGSLNLSHDTEVGDWMGRVLDRLPHGALLITGEDRHTFALDYVRWVEGTRLDLLVVDGELFSYDWYRSALGAQSAATGTPPDLTDLHTALVEPQADLAELISESLAHREVYLASRRQSLEQAFDVKPMGDLWRVALPNTPSAGAKPP